MIEAGNSEAEAWWDANSPRAPLNKKRSINENETYLTPRVSWQFLRFIVMGIPGPAWAKYLLNVMFTADPSPEGR